ncbi:hypothetical protein IW262DRAFT_1372338 [Armillaria fumosa]|nr:hypothetical protein IW262DRAFT_1372338 [Armillaria fumosa]
MTGFSGTLKVIVGLMLVVISGLETSAGPADYRIAGVYYASFHFTERYVDTDRIVWYNDGMVQARPASREGGIMDIKLNHNPNGKEIAYYIYVRNMQPAS